MKTRRLSSFGWGSSIRSWWEHVSRHGRSILPHLTLVRLGNAVLLLLELALRSRYVHTRPLVIKIEPTNICNFKCPGCRTGSGEDTSPRGRIRFEEFQRIVDATYRHALKVILYMWGEPLLHRDIFRMIEYARDKNLAVQISSNLNVFRDGYAEQIVDSGLEHLIVAADGVSQETYQVYRVGGQIQKVIDNVAAILRARTQKKQKFPFVELQYIVFPHNRHEIPQAKQLAAWLGVDKLTFIDSFSGQEEQKAKVRVGQSRRPDKCNSLWIMACFNWDGSFSPCCDSVDDSFGNILEQDFAELWNSERMQKSRSLHGRHLIKGGPKTKCSKCRIYGSYMTFGSENKGGISATGLVFPDGESARSSDQG